MAWFLVIVLVIPSGTLLYLNFAFADDLWNLAQLQIVHEASLIGAVIVFMLRAAPGPATATPANGDQEAEVEFEPNFECPKGRDGRPLLH
jgi:hypothetical protein